MRKMTLAFAAALAALLNTPLPAQSNFRVASTLTMDYEGYMLSFGYADFIGDGTATMVAAGFRFPLVDLGLPLKAININRAGHLADVTSRLIDGNPQQVHARKGVVADFNGDGRPDFFSASHGYDVAPFPGDSQVLLLSQPDGRLKDESASLVPKVKQFVHSAAAADLKLNGRPDLFVGVTHATPKEELDPIYSAPAPRLGYLGPYMLRNDGSGHFTFDNQTLPAKVVFSYDTSVNPWSPWDSPGYILWSSFADLNNDRYPDLILLGANKDENFAGAVYFNDGSGGFKTTEHKLPPGLFGVKNSKSHDVLAVDVDGDALRDLILVQANGSYLGNKIQILINKGEGLFVDETGNRLPGQPGTGRWAELLRSVDIDGDGHLDIMQVISFPEANQVIAYKNDGRGNYSPMPAGLLPSTQGTGYAWLTPLDYNGDGKIDFLSIANRFANTNRTIFTVLENVRR
jgi:hypothetical protein